MHYQFISQFFSFFIKKTLIFYIIVIIYKLFIFNRIKKFYKYQKAKLKIKN